MSERLDRMIDYAPDYYRYSTIYKAVQNAMAVDLDGIEVSNDEIKLQLSILTATWGLKYWEQVLHILTVETDSYSIRRSRVLSAWRGIGNFSAELIKVICESFSNGEVSVRCIIPEFKVVVTFVGARGIPPNLNDLKAQVDNIIHAHLGIEWYFTYLIWDELDAEEFTWNAFEAYNTTGFTWNTLEVWRPA